MRILSSLVSLILFLALMACSNDAPSAAELAAQAEVARLDSINQLLEASIKEVEQDAKELKEALKELDELFPEENQQ